MADDLDAYLNSLSDKVQAELSDVIRAEAEKLSAAQRVALKALEQSPDESGNLEQSCIVTPGANDLEFIVQAGGELTTVEIRDGSGVDWDRALGFEFGTSKQPARPFFWPTYRERRSGIIDAIDGAINEALK